ncbi:MAG: hypothetical protein WCO84_01915 [bacterium]
MSEDKVKTNYRGSEITRELIFQQISERYGAESAKQYDPYSNCRTFRDWRSLGYVVKKGEKSLRSITIVEKKNDQGVVIKKYPKTIHLFYYPQVEKLSSN